MDRSSHLNVLPDFQRRVYCVLGLPFDALTMDQAVAKVRQAVLARSRCLLVTPNLNFIAESARDARFRDTLLEADLSLADGMPLIWTARCLGIALRHRVSGADLFEALDQTATPRKISVFLFGGNHGVAVRAGEQIATHSVGLSCAGALEPLFGTAEELSERSIIDAINASGADFLVMALGARKAHEWIARNQEQLAPHVIAHLGAVIKYHAGLVARAPKRVQRMGLEWLWRVKEEPPLWRRYLRDGAVVGKLLFGRALPAALRTLFAAFAPVAMTANEAIVEFMPGSAAVPNVLRIAGAWNEPNSGPLRHALAQAVASAGDLRLDLSTAWSMDSAIVGLLLLLRGHFLRCGSGLEFASVSAAARRSLQLYGADYLLEPLSTRPRSTTNTTDATWLAPQFPTRVERAD